MSWKLNALVYLSLDFSAELARWLIALQVRCQVHSLLSWHPKPAVLPIAKSVTHVTHQGSVS